MVFLLVTKVIAAVILLICLGFLGYWFIAWKQGNCDFRVLRGKKSDFSVDGMDTKKVTLSCTVPIKNVGRQNGTIMDAFVRHYMPEEQYDKVAVRTLLMDTARPRTDDYWEALIVLPKEAVELKVLVELTSRSGNLLRDLEDFPDMPLDIIYQTVGRSDWTYEKGRIELTREELRNALYEKVNGGRA